MNMIAQSTLMKVLVKICHYSRTAINNLNMSFLALTLSLSDGGISVRNEGFS